MRRPIALALALAIFVLALFACPTRLRSWNTGPAGNATNNQCATGHCRAGCE